MQERGNDRLKIIPQRLREARIACGKTIKEVSEAIGVSAQVLSMYELGRCNLSAEVFYRLKNEYTLPIKYYTKPYQENVNRSQTFFRSFSSATKSKREIAFIQSEWFTKEIIFPLEEKIKFPPVDEFFSRIKKSLAVEKKKKRNVDSLSKIIRREWGLGLGPISNLTRVLEKKGVIIVKMDLDDAIDGFSYWYQKRPFIIINKNNNAFRLRMSIAHELCHLFFHEADDVEKNLKELEAEAKYFASAFLMPDSSFAKDVYSTSLEQLLYLKPKWMVSVQAMIMRCNQLDLITEDRMLYLQKQISRKRWRKFEPGDNDYDPETPVLLQQAIRLLIEKNILSKNEMLDTFALENEFIEEVCSLPNRYLSQEDNIVSLNSGKSN